MNDRAGVLDDSSRARLESFLDQVKRRTGVQFAVLAVRTTAPLDPVAYKTEAYRRWFGGNDNSLLLLVALEERKAHFETGYELEGILPDGLEARILRREAFPRFADRDYAGGIRAAVLRVSAIVAEDRGVALEWDGSELHYGDDDGGAPPPWALAVIAFLVLLVLFSVIAAARHGGGTGTRRGDWWSGPGTDGWGGGRGAGWGGGWSGSGGGGGFGGFSGGGGFGSGGGGGGGGW